MAQKDDSSQIVAGSATTLEEFRCPKCGNYCIIKEQHAFPLGKKLYQVGCDWCGILTDVTTDRETAIEKLRNGEVHCLETDDD